ncbi:unnamed protein product [Brugia timori]|uniref:Uncharacterized protein n=1 Tax=Brugia timori TaxID=42155 RepID=A0A0R3Q5V7_9BILA|nr:unnamed protein product [Brugia timori]
MTYFMDCPVLYCTCNVKGSFTVLYVIIVKQGRWFCSVLDNILLKGIHKIFF